MLPLDDRIPDEIINDPRPQPEPPRDTYIYFPGTADVPEVGRRQYPRPLLPDPGRRDDRHARSGGVLFAHGSRFGGHALFLKDQKLWYVYNFLGIPPEQQFVSDKLKPGKYMLGMEFTKESMGQYDESHGTTKLYVNEDVVASGPMRTQLGTFTLCGDGLCIGRDSADPVSAEYKSPYASPAARSTRSRSTSATTCTSISRRRPPRCWPASNDRLHLGAGQSGPAEGRGVHASRGRSWRPAQGRLDPRLADHRRGRREPEPVGRERRPAVDRPGVRRRPRRAGPGRRRLLARPRGIGPLAGRPRRPLRPEDAAPARHRAVDSGLPRGRVRADASRSSSRARIVGGVSAGMAYPTTLALITALWAPGPAGRTRSPSGRPSAARSRRSGRSSPGFLLERFDVGLGLPGDAAARGRRAVHGLAVRAGPRQRDRPTPSTTLAASCRRCSSGR